MNRANEKRASKEDKKEVKAKSIKKKTMQIE